MVPLWAAGEYFFPGREDGNRGFRRDLGLREGDILLLYAGSMSEAKGLLLLQKVLPRFPRLRMASAGNGPLAAGLQATPGGQWTHLGALEGEALRRFYQAGDYLILPSLTLPDWKEQIGRALIEGILCGCVALGSDSGHIPELTLFPETTFRQGEAESLAEMLARLPLPDRDRVRHGQHDNVTARFTAEAAARGTWEFLRGVGA